MTAPRLGVVVATHDGERYLGEQLASILGGSRRPDHVILTDDDSTDGTLDLARALLEASGVPYDILVNRPALGVAANVMGAIARSEADVVVLSDQDDRWHRDRLAAVERVFEDPAVVLAHGDADIVDGSGRTQGTTLFRMLEVRGAELEAIREGRAFETYLRRNLATGATMAVRRATIADALDVPDGWIHDEWLAIVAATRGRVVVESTPLVDYRLHGGNQIGADVPTLRRKVERVLASDGGRRARLARRSASLATFLESAGADPRFVEAAREKAVFDARRAALPKLRIARLPSVLAGLVAGRYARLASQGRLDVVRDLLQPK